VGDPEEFGCFSTKESFGVQVASAGPKRTQQYHQSCLVTSRLNGKKTFRCLQKKRQGGKIMNVGCQKKHESVARSEGSDGHEERRPRKNRSVGEGFVSNQRVLGGNSGNTEKP